jgi:hypothetical protein
MKTNKISGDGPFNPEIGKNNPSSISCRLWTIFLFLLVGIKTIVGLPPLPLWPFFQIMN